MDKVHISGRSQMHSSCIGKRLKFRKFKIIFQTGYKLKKYFRFKDRVPETLQPNFVYKFKCGSWTASYYGKTYRHMKVRVSEHQGVSPRTGKQVKGMLSTAVRDHMLNCDHTVAWEGKISLSLVESRTTLLIGKQKKAFSLNETNSPFSHLSRIIFCIDSRIMIIVL